MFVSTIESMCAPPPVLLKGDPSHTDGSPRKEDQAKQATGPSRNTLRCKICQAEVANEHDVFSASPDGPVGAYINPAGFVHEIVTLRAVTCVSLVGLAVAKASWFIGYTWTIAHCTSCQAHLGWQFNAMTGQTPSIFWGLRRASLTES